MKRYGELTLTIVGVLISGFLFIVTSILFFTIKTSETEELAQQFLNDENITEVSVEQIVSALHMGAAYMSILFLITSVFGLIAFVFIKKNRNLKAARNILMITAIAESILTLMVGLVVGIVYLIAGLMIVFRKERRMI